VALQDWWEDDIKIVQGMGSLKSVFKFFEMKLTRDGKKSFFGFCKNFFKHQKFSTEYSNPCHPQKPF
jgi:hypothetical protein